MKEPAMCASIVEAMQQNGAYEEVMDAGPELGRMKTFVQMMSKPCEISGQRQRPGMPLFPGLSAEPFRDPAVYPAVALLESGFDSIANEARQLVLDDFLTYFPRGTPNSEAVATADPGKWKMFLFSHMGSWVKPSIEKCPKTYDAIRQLPDFCGDYPWCDALFSLHLPGTHLPPHCSMDNLRIRIHLGIDIPGGCTIRVDEEVRRWQSGQCLVFDESFEHETRNETDANRTVLIVDVWHPDLTDDERAALLRMFNDVDVKKVFFMKRLKNINADPVLIRELELQSMVSDGAFRRS